MTIDLAPVLILWAVVGTPLQAATPAAGIGGAIEGFVGSLDPQSAALYGGSGVASLGAVRYLIKRRAASGSSGGTSVSTSGGASVATTTRSGGSKHKVAFTLPSFLPVSKGIRSVTHNEIHALELGILVGGVSVWLFSVGRTRAVYGIVIAFVVGSLGFRRYGSKAFKTIRLEPWYALISLAIGAGLGWSLFMMEPSLTTQLGLTGGT
ncbi:hypothetical protein DP107_16840 [Haloglomus irregulare]|jgi:hypothetical protein|uniref:Uncharacterized protein n=1 Tax=Haloglomus irregulare TaxID=2234134 RepID=A0A554MVP9_9EURY|nr:hypothetical protein [Haloglomus irregulare]TSD09192.1 hypothetical protein DP107_16840 [Haloglomus irregulare]